jgi:Sulfotransferase family
MSSSLVERPNSGAPIFVLGALRSGTTVFRLMLDAHKDIANPGEVDFIFRYLKADGQSDNWSCDVERLRIDRTFQSYRLSIPEVEDGKYLAVHFVDQFRQRTIKQLTLNIHGNLGKVAAIFPDAKIIHIIRDPRDVARSCMGMGWAGNTYHGVDQWHATEADWESFASKFKTGNVMEFKFESLILNPRMVLDDVCRFIGVPFSTEMLEYPESSTYRPPDLSLVQQWKSALGARDVALVEIRTKSLLLARHYELSGAPLDPPSKLELIWLICTNKIYKWQFAWRRYGWFNFIMEIATRKFIKSYHYLFAERVNEIEQQYLK